MHDSVSLNNLNWFLSMKICKVQKEKNHCIFVETRKKSSHYPNTSQFPGKQHELRAVKGHVHLVQKYVSWFMYHWSLKLSNWNAYGVSFLVQSTWIGQNEKCCIGCAECFDPWWLLLNTAVRISHQSLQTTTKHFFH